MLLQAGFLLLNVTINSGWANPEAGAFSLSEAVRYGFEHSPTFDALKRASTVSELNQKVTFAGFLPSVDATTTDGVQTPQAAPDNGLWTSSFTLSVSENVYDNGLTLLNYKIASFNRELASVQLLQGREQMALSIATEFYNYSLLSELLAVKELQIKMVRKQAESVTNQYHQGMKTRMDYIRFQAQVERSELDLVGQRNSVLQSATNLRNLMGIPLDVASANPGGAAALVFLTYRPSQPLPQFPSQGPPVLKSYDYRVTDIQNQINLLNQKITNLKYWPQVAVSANASQLYSNFLGPGSSLDASNQLTINALVTVTYNLWDWNIRRNTMQMSDETLQSQNDTLNTTRISLGATIASMMATLDQLNTAYRLDGQLLKMTQESYDFLDQQYKLGKIQYLDLVTGLNDLLAAKVQYYTDYYTILQKLAQYRYYEGSLYDFIAGRS